VTGLEALAEQTPNATFSEVLEQIGRSVGHGISLAAALEQYPRVFPEMMVALVRAGEEGGRLPETLVEAGRQLELQMEIRQKLISALVYPVFTLVATIGTVIFMLLWVVPTFAAIYKDLNATLPAITLSVVWASDTIRSYGLLVILVVAAAIYGLRRYYQTPAGRLRLDGIKLKIPLFGPVYLKSATATLTGSLSGLVESGVPLIKALETSGNACGNALIADAVVSASRNVVLGRRLSDELEISTLFPLMVTRMIAISEDVGTLPMVLKEISQAYTTEVEHTIRRILTIIEPVVILCVAFVVGYVLLALYYPIFLLADTFQKGA
jgi:type IV pilus assembly protein PilC